MFLTITVSTRKKNKKFSSLNSSQKSLPGERSLVSDILLLFLIYNQAGVGALRIVNYLDSS